MNKKGFTLIELLVVIGIIAILAGVVVVALNPARQFSQANNTKRWANVNTILNAVGQYMVDNQGSLPASVSALAVDTAAQICATGVAAADCTAANLVNLSVLTNNEIYLVELPKDPKVGTCGNVNGIGYTISRSTNNRIAIAVPVACQELQEAILVKR